MENILHDIRPSHGMPYDTAVSMIKLIQQFDYLRTLILLLCIAGITVILVIGCEKRRRVIASEEKTPETKKPTRKKYWIFTWGEIITATICFITMFLFVAGFTITMTARSHGLYQTNMTWEDMIDNIESSVKEDRLPSDPSNCLIVYYKFGCPDCNAIFKDESQILADVTDIYWISTRSSQGKKLLEQYPVDEVPALVYINADKQGISKVIYKKQNGKSVIDEDAVNTIIELYAYGHD